MTDTTIGKRVYRNPLSDYQDQVYFGIAFAAGAVAILTLKALGVQQWIVTIVPVALMFVYAAVAWLTKRFRLREDRVGDNVYYLGFLFTLVSLAYALVVYRPDGSGVTTIITNFGIAIATTIAGLSLRVLFNQMREDPVEYEAEARKSLAEASGELRAQLYGIAEDMASFKRAMIQMAKEGAEEATKAARQSLEESVEQFAKVANEVLDNIRNAFASFTEHSTRLNDLAGRNAEALEALFKRIENIDASPELLSRKLTPIVEKFAEIADEAARRNRNQTNDLKRFKDLIDTAMEASDHLHKSLSESDGALRIRLQQFNNDLGKVSDIAGQLTSTLNGSGLELSTQLKATKALSSELLTNVREQSDAGTKLRTAMEAELEQARTYKAELERMSQESQDAVTLLQSSLVSLSKTMVEQLGGHASP